jgi:hypothetical protein
MSGMSMLRPSHGPTPVTAAPSLQHDLAKRLPVGVEYTHVKMICHGLPSRLELMLWLGPPSSDPNWKLFRGKTYRALDRALLRAEGKVAELGAGADDTAKRHVEMLRYAFVQHAMWAIRTLDPEGHSKHVIVRLINPPVEQDRVRERERRGWLLEVWDLPARKPRLRDRVFMPATPAPFGRPEVDCYDAPLADRLTAAVVRRNFPNLMRSRIGHGLRSERRPTGWPMLTKRVIPRLYDYLWPFFTARSYRKGLREIPTPGNYPTRLMQVMTDSLRLELPHLAKDLTPERVQAAVQRYLPQARPNRPMGAAMFRIWPKKNSPT